MSYWITASAMLKYYMLAVESGSREVGGFSKFHVDEHGNHIVTDLTALRQESTAVYFEIDAGTKGIHFENVVAGGGDPKFESMMFHTHPSGMTAQMSEVDVKQLEEMAMDLPGVIARSMILAQGSMSPMIHEAVCVEGRVFMRRNVTVKLLDNTGAKDQLKEIGWFDKPKPKPVQQHVQRSSGRGMVWTGRSWDQNDGWYDETPETTEAPVQQDAYSQWLDEKRAEEADEWDCNAYIGCQVLQNGSLVGVTDAYVWDCGIVLVLANSDEVLLEDVDVVDTNNIRNTEAAEAGGLQRGA